MLNKFASFLKSIYLDRIFAIELIEEDTIVQADRRLLKIMQVNIFGKALNYTVKGLVPWLKFGVANSDY